MEKPFKESLSAFIDNEQAISSEEMEHLHNDPDVRALWQRYHIIRDVMTQHYVANTAVLSQRISHRIAEETVVAMPQRSKRGKRILQQVAGFAMAATIAGVAIILVQQQQPVHNSIPQTAKIAPITTAPVRLTSAVENKLSGYLLNHNEYSKTVQMQGMLPYTRIVSFTPSQRVAEK